jgi:RNA polymerase subunit RPABC4/transcription elongation factor Spt4
MKFQLLNLIVWPKAETLAPRVIKFELGKLNVITGSSRTGKSAIIPIIDYCLASSDCLIPIDTIRDYTAWYGIVVQTSTEQILIARKVPSGTKVSNEYFLSRGEKISIPPAITTSNENTDGVKAILNAISSVPYFSLSAQDDKRAYEARLGFRDLVALVFQSQDIVANQNIIFYKTHAHEHRERLRNWFPYILGAEDIEILAARQRLAVLEGKLNQLKKELLKTKQVSAAWMSNMTGHLQAAQQYGLFTGELSDSIDPDQLVLAAKSVIENIPRHPQSSLGNLEAASDAFLRLEAEDEKLSDEIGGLKKRLDDVKRLKSGLIDFGGSARKRADRLQISQWLNEFASGSNNCPICGSQDHVRSVAEFQKISVEFKKVEDMARNIKVVPTAFAREEEQIRIDLDRVLETRRAIQVRLDQAMSENKTLQEQFQRRENMYLFLGHLKASLETFEKVADDGELQSNVTKLEAEYQELLSRVDSRGVQFRLDHALSKVAQKVLKHLATLDVEEKYRSVAPRLSVKDLSISVPSSEGHWHFLAEVGSASNWVSFHLALMCALQEYFLEQSHSCVPSFVIFDQPSQVYFPKLKRSISEVVDPAYEDEDVGAVKRMFKTLAKSVLDSSGGWQCIVLDHAGSEIYGEVPGVHEVEVWRDGKKLIPSEWYE